MFEFTGRLKLISIILMVIGAISVTASFFVDYGGHHGEEHGEHATHDGGHADATHQGEEGVKDYSEYHVEEIPEDIGDEYHKSAARAVPENNHYYRTLEKEVEAETLHHQAENMPWANLLVSNFFFLAIALGALFFMAVQYAAQVGWSAVLLRIMEAMSSFLWIPMLIMLVLIVTGLMHVGGNHLWHWMDGDLYVEGSAEYDSIIAGKRSYLNGPFFLIRYAVYFIGWVGGALLLRRMSKKMNKDSAVDPRRQWIKMRNLSAGFLVFFAVTSSTSAWDWFMSIDTHWFSTLFGWYTFATMFVSALTALALITIYLKNKGYLPEVNDSHIHDLGKFMFAFSVFWTYLWFSQFMLIWYSNIPEEVTYYMARWGEYKWLFLGMVGLNFVMPITILMSRDSKRNFGFLLVTGLIILFGHWLDIFIMVMPGTVGGLWQVGLIQLGTLLGFGGLFIFVVFSSLAKRPLMIKRHPMFIESKHFHI